MKLKDDPKIKMVTWFLDFLNDDLDALLEFQLSEYVLDIKMYCLSLGLSQESDYPRYIGAGRDVRFWQETIQKFAKKLLVMRDHIYSHDFDSPRDALDDIMKMLVELQSVAGQFFPLKEPDLWKDILKEIQVDLKKAINKIVTLQDQNLHAKEDGFIHEDFSLTPDRLFTKDLSPGPLLDRILADDFSLTEAYPSSAVWSITAGETKFQLVTDRKNLILDFYPRKDWLKDFPDVPDRQGLSQSVRIAFCSAVNGLPIETIKSCKECEKYFLHLSKKPRYFCSTKCGSRYANRERRKDPEEYEKYKAEQQQRYREKVAKEQGKPIDKIRWQEKSTQKKKEGK